jgi:GTPase
MALPRIAIIGRPNVGKSSLMNMLARARVSIVDPTPGVTRDRVSTVIELVAPDRIADSKLVEITDTGGYGVYTEAGKQFTDIGEDLGRLTDDIEAQIGEAIESADLILFIIDAQTGITPLDETVARLLRERGGERRVLLVANKVDGENWEQHAYEAAQLGLGAPIMVSAAHSYMRRQFLETLYDAVPEVSDADRQREDNLVKLAIIGKRNAGKSTLINALAGEKRVIVSDIAGTTRDAVDVRVQRDGITFLAIDTAGVRKRKSLADDVEWYALHRALRSVRRADVVLFMVDAATEISQVDKKLSKEIQDQYKPCVIVVNKWDVVEERNATAKKEVTPDDYMEYLDKQLIGLDYAPISLISAEEGEGLSEMLQTAFLLYRQAQERLPTSQINEIVQEILAERGPSTKLGRVAKLYYASQVGVAPPTIALMVNDPDHFSPQYRRYLLNALRKRLPFSEIPIQLVFRARKRADLADIKSGDYRKARLADEAAKKSKAEKTAKRSDILPGKQVRSGGERAIEAPPLSEDELRKLDEKGEA